ncbi:hypothetical protein M407DRAFT_231218 [Tulasnella calospora MUT 4182]|uniref:Uncharacterized protein n=1 Tax=Tulasnella calospora MUT 4182 TaxID=1051891 RepID=A0A0C3K5G1_9AGAM|nr:hypothetical protein M407DRAFT_231218 [Tulasnella calospora MUT 4182]
MIKEWTELTGGTGLGFRGFWRKGREGNTTLFLRFIWMPSECGDNYELRTCLEESVIYLGKHTPPLRMTPGNRRLLLQCSIRPKNTDRQPGGQVVAHSFCGRNCTEAARQKANAQQPSVRQAAAGVAPPVTRVTMMDSQHASPKHSEGVFLFARTLYALANHPPRFMKNSESAGIQKSYPSLWSLVTPTMITAFRIAPSILVTLFTFVGKLFGVRKPKPAQSATPTLSLAVSSTALERASFTIPPSNRRRSLPPTPAPANAASKDADAPTTSSPGTCESIKVHRHCSKECSRAARAGTKGPRGYDDSDEDSWPEDTLPSKKPQHHLYDGDDDNGGGVVRSPLPQQPQINPGNSKVYSCCGCTVTVPSGAPPSECPICKLDEVKKELEAERAKPPVVIRIPQSPAPAPAPVPAPPPQPTQASAPVPATKPVQTTLRVRPSDPVQLPGPRKVTPKPGMSSRPDSSLLITVLTSRSCSPAPLQPEPAKQAAKPPVQPVRRQLDEDDDDDEDDEEEDDDDEDDDDMDFFVRKPDPSPAPGVRNNPGYNHFVLEPSLASTNRMGHQSLTLRSRRVLSNCCEVLLKFLLLSEGVCGVALRSQV